MSLINLSKDRGFLSYRKPLSKLDDNSLFCIYSYNLTAVEFINACLAASMQADLNTKEILLSEVESYANASFPNIDMGVFKKEKYHKFRSLEFSDSERTLIISCCIMSMFIIDKSLRFKKFLDQVNYLNFQMLNMNNLMAREKHRLARTAVEVDNILRVKDLV